MGDAVDLVTGGILVYLFFRLLPEVKTITGITQGEQVILILILGYGAIFGLRIAANGLVNILQGTVKWWQTTDSGKAFAVKLKNI
jgi:hypothetical protein